MDRQPSKASLSRRDFLQGTGAVLGGLAATSSLGFAREQAVGRINVPKVVLGRTGVEVSRLGIGCAHFQRESVSVEDVRKTLHRALELGVNYLDVAPNYGNAQRGYAEEKMGPSLPEIREKVFLVTKTEEPTYEGTWTLLRQSMKRLQTDHLDLVHLHNIGDEPRWPDLKMTFGPRGALGALKEAKRQGVVRFIGASGHLHPTRFHAAIDTGDIDVLMNAVNFVVQHTYDFEHKVWARAHRENLGLVAMKVLGGAGNGEKGFRLPEDHYEQAIRYALSIPGVCVAVIGLENVAELEKAAETVAKATPLSEDEARALAMEGLRLSAESSWKVAYGQPLT